MIVFDIQQERLGEKKHLSDRWLQDLSRAMDRELGKSLKGIVSVAFVSAPRMRTITKEYKGEDHVSDILTFPLLAPRAWKRGEIIGEILLCHPRILKQAKEKKINPQSEIAFLLVHGVLHLCGMSHLTDRKLSHMIRAQKAILDQAGILYSL
ncbi:MAG: putative rRNA maturation factor [Candidatus Uhrbacteria bacterium GW2011_GWE2_46_68]|uniref:Endoribonuclease YbeY n=2 Tax=Candidatus Uhriibacteriota TaxID=1752732 RepID=A0A0G1Q730_9BACT|nr:MAG: putative rRNA maturation factor [Candidatus Uhrbacteria bacterium GW2011_GWF2_46_218]KKU40612.1 MAG: putative rRNA maturation factor [Candidatus Uhrbacteria bacterium GW2011_GWE2_46_68]